MLVRIFYRIFVRVFDIISIFAAELKEPKIGMLGKGLIYLCNFPTYHVNYGLINSIPGNNRLTSQADCSSGIHKIANSKSTPISLYRLRRLI